MSQLHQTKNHGKLIAIIFFMIASLLAVVIYFGIVLPYQHRHSIQPKINGVILPTPTEIQSFQLIDNHGETFTNDNLKGHWTMLFFGFTNCDYVCPTTLSSLNKMYHSLQAELPDNQLPQIVLISVDPERDSVKRLNSYMMAFNSHFLGARTSVEKTIELQKQFHIAAAKMQAEGKGKNHYTMSHTAEILLINPNGKLQAYFSYPHQPEQLVKDYKTLLNLSSQKI